MEYGGFGFNVGEGSGPVGLGLELGCGSGYERSKISLGFTVFQLQELKLQSLIYKYMEAGLPVPHHLVLPIWKSCFAAPHHQFYSTSAMGPLNLEYRNGLDLEPGRCRRTDGKKWRCSKEAVPDHKYCEKHLHRGRQRSRKLVEAASRNTSNAKTDLSISLVAANNSRTEQVAQPPAFGFWEGRGDGS